jgi:hypothetical protein
MKVIYGLLLLLLVLNIFDFATTIYLVDRGYQEGNPLVASLISISPEAYMIVKVFILSSLILLVFDRLRRNRDKLSFKVFSFSRIALFFVVIVYLFIVINNSVYLVKAEVVNDQLVYSYVEQETKNYGTYGYTVGILNAQQYYIVYNWKEAGNLEFSRVYCDYNGEACHLEWRDDDNDGVKETNEFYPIVGKGYWIELSYNGHVFYKGQLVIYPNYFDLIPSWYDYEWVQNNMPSGKVRIAYQLGNVYVRQGFRSAAPDLINVGLVASTYTSGTLPSIQVLYQRATRIVTNININYTENKLTKLWLNDSEQVSNWNITYYDWIDGIKYVETNDYYESNDFNKSIQFYGYPISAQVGVYPNPTSYVVSYTFPDPPEGWKEEAESQIGQNLTVTFYFIDASTGSLLNGVDFVYWGTGINETIVTANQTYQVEVPYMGELHWYAEKDGYVEADSNIGGLGYIQEDQNVILEFIPLNVSIEDPTNNTALIFHTYDNRSYTALADVYVTISYDDQSETKLSNDNGYLVFEVPKNTTITYLAKKSGYFPFSDSISVGVNQTIVQVGLWPQVNETWQPGENGTGIGTTPTPESGTGTSGTSTGLRGMAEAVLNEAYQYAPQLFTLIMFFLFIAVIERSGAFRRR